MKGLEKVSILSEPFNQILTVDKNFIIVLLWERHKKSHPGLGLAKKLNPEVCRKTGTLGGFRCEVRNNFVILQIAIR